jgi:hypothetical protein
MAVRLTWGRRGGNAAPTQGHRIVWRRVGASTPVRRFAAPFFKCWPRRLTNVDIDDCVPLRPMQLRRCQQHHANDLHGSGWVHGAHVN